MNDPRTAATQYGDLEGESSADCHIESDMGLVGLARGLGVPGFPVGFSIYRGNSPNQSDESAADDRVHLSIYTASHKAGYGADEISRTTQEQGGTLLVTEHTTKISLLSLLRYFKRINVTLFNRSIKADNIEVTESIDLEDRIDEEE